MKDNSNTSDNSLSNTVEENPTTAETSLDDTPSTTEKTDELKKEPKEYEDEG